MTLLDEIKELMKQNKPLTAKQIIYIRNNPTKFRSIKPLYRKKVNAVKEKKVEKVAVKKRPTANVLRGGKYNKAVAKLPVIKLPVKPTPKPIIKLPKPPTKPVIKLPTKPVIKLPLKPIKLKK